jgi:hypothetical protein
MQRQPARSRPFRRGRAAAPAGVLTGTVGAVPKGARAEVRAIDLSTGAVVGARTLGRTGAFTLRLLAGGYLLADAIVPRRGRGAPEGTALPGVARRRATAHARSLDSGICTAPQITTHGRLQKWVRRYSRSVMVPGRGSSAITEEEHGTLGTSY